MGVPINNVSRRVVYAASGTGPYAFTFEILAAADIAVYKDDTLLTLTTDYTVTINANGTGSITLTASPTGATQIAIVGNRTIQRLTDFVTGGDLFANTINDELDQQTIFAQQNAEGLDRSLKAPQTDPTSINMTLPRASVRANKTLAFDTNGNPTTGEVIGDNRGNWAAGTAYNKRDIVKDTSNGNIYYANTAHTSSGSQPISSNADSAKWDLIVDNAAAGASASAAAASASAAASSASAASTSASNASSSASSAASSASAASTSASNASTSATNAASSASTASTQASNAATSATNAANSATSASNSASTATTQATNASNSASSASTSATNAANSASSASSSASSASSSASSASTSASNASTSATNAASSATAAAASATSAAASYDSFDDRYLGAKTSDPTLDNDGNALLTGALYFNSSTGEMKVYSGSAWVSSFLTAGAQTIAGVKTFSSNPILSGGTANGVAYLNGSKVLTTGSALTFDGASLDVGVGNYFGTLNAKRFVASPYSTLTLSDPATAANEVGIYLRSNGANPVGISSAGAPIAFYLGGPGTTEAMRLTSTGLGIGTSSPAYKLDVTGTINSGASSATGYNLVFRTSGITTGRAQTGLTNTSGDLYTGIEGSTAGASLVGSAAYSAFVGTFTANPLYFVTNGVIRTTLDSSGNLGLGVTPSAWSGNKAVQVNARTSLYSSADGGAVVGNNLYYNGTSNIYIASNYATAYQQNAAGQHIWFNALSGTAGNAISFTQAMTLDASSNLLVGTTNNYSVGASNYVMSKSGYIFAADNTASANNRNWSIAPNQSGNGTLDWVYSSTNTGWPNAAYAMTLTRDGNLLVGATNTAYSSTERISVTAPSGSGGVGIATLNSNVVGLGIYSGYTATGTATAVQFQDHNSVVRGSITVTTSATAYNTSSDYRLKDNPQPLTGSGAFIDALKPKTWNWTADGSRGVGFIAHEVQEVSPASVVGEKDAVDEEGKPIMQAMEYGSAEFIANIIAELQSLRARVAQLEGASA